MDDRGCVLQGLYEVWHEGVLQEDGHGTGDLDVFGGDGVSRLRVRDDDPIKAGLQIFEVSGKTEDGHELGGDGDVEARLALDALPLLTHSDVAQGAFVQVHHARPGDVLDVDIEVVALEQVVIQHSGAEVMRCGDGVKVTGEVQVDVLHRDHLRVAAAGCTALDPERGTERGLTQGGYHALADLRETHGQTHVGGGLTLTGRGGSDGGAEYQLAVGLVGQTVQDIQMDLGFVLTVEIDVVLAEAEILRHLDDGLEGSFLCDLDVAFHASRSSYGWGSQPSEGLL